MNRPLKELYISERGSSTNLTMNDYSGYIRELENYCDALEKALDKACEELEDFEYNYSLFDLDYAESKLHHKGSTHYNKDGWKEYFLNE